MTSTSVLFYSGQRNSTVTIDQAFARNFAQHWIESWNTHDLDSILSHYTDDFEMYSPLIVERMGVAEGKLQGKAAVSQYWAKGLAAKPSLHFELVDVLSGVDSVIIYYRGRKGMAAEIFYFNDEGKVFKAAAHYD